MPRVKRGTKTKARRAKYLKLAKGYWGAKSHNYRTAKEAVEKSLLYAYRDRRNKKRDFRRLWIIRIKAAAMANGLTYSRFIAGAQEIPDRARPQGPGRARRQRPRGRSPRSSKKSNPPST